MSENRKLVMQVNVSISKDDISVIDGPGEQVVFIPFSGTVEGEIFNGVVCPGGVDVQRVNLAGVRHMCARYMLKGKDFEGNDCSIFVENNGWFSEGMGPTFKTVPTFITDSPALAPYLHSRRFTGEGIPGPEGVTIRLYAEG
ncbi:MAG: DUF3237 family protein [Oscillospiraceae bacterium]|nr:DUF3237 family protein [Oscillospiraceae bacterium]